MKLSCTSAMAALGKPVKSYLSSLHQYFQFWNLDPTSWHLHKHLQEMLGSSSTKTCADPQAVLKSWLLKRSSTWIYYKIVAILVANVRWTQEGPYLLLQTVQGRSNFHIYLIEFSEILEIRIQNLHSNQAHAKQWHYSSFEWDFAN